MTSRRSSPEKLLQARIAEPVTASRDADRFPHGFPAERAKHPPPRPFQQFVIVARHPVAPFASSTALLATSSSSSELRARLRPGAGRGKRRGGGGGGTGLTPPSAPGLGAGHRRPLPDRAPPLSTGARSGPGTPEGKGERGGGGVLSGEQPLGNGPTGLGTRGGTPTAPGDGHSGSLGSIASRPAAPGAWTTPPPASVSPPTPPQGQGFRGEDRHRALPAEPTSPLAQAGVPRGGSHSRTQPPELPLSP